MFQRFKISNADKKRHLDDNGYITVDESPILRAGILEYYGSELIDGSDGDEIDGVKIIPDKVYRVYIPPEELERAADSFKLLPITNDHEWLGNGGADARDFQEGSTGESVTVKDDMIFVPLKFTGDEIITSLNHGKEELSASYTNTLSKSDNADYDFVATDIKGNHVALVEKGRCGPDVKVLNKQMERKHMKIKNEMKLILDGKEIDLNEFFKQEQGESAHEGTGAIVGNEDKREIIREIMAVAGKSNDDFEGGEDEKVREIAKLAERLAYEPSETSKSDNEDKRKEIDEVGGFLKDKGLSDEDIRFVIGKMEKDAYAPSEDSKSDNEDKDADDEDKDADDDKKEDKTADNACKSHNAAMSSFVAKIANAVARQSAKKDAGLKRAYNAASEVLGEFNPFGMTEREMLVRALNHAGVDVDKETDAELYAMLKVCNTTARVDNSFDYNASGKDEVEINI